MLLVKLRRGASRAVSGRGWLPLASFQRIATALEAPSSSSTKCGTSNFAVDTPSLPRAVAAGTGASGAPGHAVGSRKCSPRHEIQFCGSSGLHRLSLAGSQPPPYPGSTPDFRTCSTQAAASGSSSQGHSSLGRKTLAAASAPTSSGKGYIEDSPSPAVPTLGSGSQSSVTDVSPPASLTGSPHGQPSLLTDVVGSAQEPQLQRARRGPVGKRTGSKAGTVSAASPSDVAAAVDAPGSTAANGGEQDASASVPGSTGNDLPPQPTRKASRGRRTKLLPAKDDNSSSSMDEDDEEPKTTRPPNNQVRQKNTLPCPTWKDLMSTIKGKPLSSRTQQGLDGAPEGSADEVLQALTLLGLPDRTVAKLMKPSTGLLRHQNLEELIAILDLYREYELSTGQVRSLLKDTSQSFSRDAAALRQILDYLLNVGVTRCQLGKVVVASKAVGLDIDGILRPKVTFLSSLDAGSVGTLVKKAPRLLSVKLSRLQDNAQMLRAALGEEEWVRLLERNVQVLTFPTEDMNEFMRTIQGRYQLGPGVLATILSRVTMFLKTTVDRMEGTLEHLESVVGRENVVDVLTREPRVLLRDPKATETTIQNLSTIMTPATVRDILLRNPSILLPDWSKKSEPALRYVVERCGISYEEAVRARVFGPSLEGVLKPRVEFLLSQGKVFAPGEQCEASKDPHPSTTLVKLSMVVYSSRKMFQRRFPEYQGQ